MNNWHCIYEDALRKVFILLHFFDGMHYLENHKNFYALFLGFCKSKGLEYSSCGTTCGNFLDDPRTCEPGCFCPDGLALHENGTCVYPEDCQCVEGGKFYNSGEVSPSDCSRYVPRRRLRF